MAKRSEDRKATPWFQHDWFLGLILVLVILLTYSPLWWAGYIWDDDNHLTANPCIVGPLGLMEIWTTRAADICPMTLTTFWMEHALWGLEPYPYHLVNVLMHGACAMVLWRVLRSLRVPGAWLGATLWALHPVEVESVAWITEMKNTESGLFFLLSILFFLRFLNFRECEGQTGRNWNYAFTLLFAALAMASKASTVILPAVLCLCAWWMEGRWHWRNLTRIAPVISMSVAASAAAIVTVNLHGTNADTVWARTWPECLAGAGDAVWFYLGKLVWPYPLMTVYPRWEINAENWVAYLPLLAVIMVFGVLWRKRKTWFRSWFFIFVYFLVALLPVLGLVDHFILRFSLVFDHLQYLAAMGPLALLAAGMSRLSDIVIPGNYWLRTSLCGGLVLMLGLSSWDRAWIYENTETLWTDALAKNPNAWVGYYNLGTDLAQKGEVNAAIIQFERAVKINPGFTQAHSNLGAAYLNSGHFDQAIVECQKALHLNPNLAEAYNNLGGALAQKGQLAAAAVQFRQALYLKPGYTDAQINLARVETMLRKSSGSK